MQEENRERQEICRAIFDEVDQLLRVVYQHRTNPIKLETPVYAKFEDKFYLLPDELAKNIRKIHSKIDKANAFLGSTDIVDTMRRDDLWYNYLPHDLATLQQELRKCEGLMTKSESDDNNARGHAEPTSMTNPLRWDLFICHANEDKEEIARPLAKALEQKNLRVWYDEFTLTLGDSLSESIDQGLAKSRFGVVILSPAFFKKKWTRKELDGLTAKEISSGKVILPIWHNVDQNYVLQYSPTLADKLAVSTDKGLEEVVDEILKAVEKASQKPEMNPQTEKISSYRSGDPKVPLLEYKVTQIQSNGVKRRLPSIGFNIMNHADYPAQVRIFAEVYLDGKLLGYPSPWSGLYNGKDIWNLNPKRGVMDGNCTVPINEIKSNQRLVVKIIVEVVNKELASPLPVSWVYMHDVNDWYFEPTA